MKKTIIVSLFSTFLILSGCGTKEEDMEKNSTEGSGEVADNKEVTETVVFKGLADPHTMEVKKGDKVLTIQFDPELLEEIQTLEDGKEVKVKYRENENKQLELVKIIK
ncbi:hypothetical protein I7V34_15040 [Bacillus sp. V3]|nr:hypothetical protein I7V34_15040 [Bacillus sp. V3]